jgi:hypothetical protein
MPDDPKQQLTPFQRAAREAAARDAAAKGVAAPPSVAPAPGGRNSAAPSAGQGRGVFGAPAGQVASREGFLATESAQYLATQRVRMENARLAAERQRLSLEVERHKSHIFIKKQELARVVTRLRSAESALVAAEAEERRARAGLGATAGAIHEKMSARDHLAVERESTERDFERREVAEAKSVDQLAREMDKLAKRSSGYALGSAQYRDLERKRKDRERGLQSIRLERGRRRAEASAKDAGLARQIAAAERAELTARRAADLAANLAAKYRLQVRAFSVAKQTLDADLERMGRELSRAESAVRQNMAAAPRV